MAVPVQTPFIEYVANGVTTNFSLGFDCENQSHLIVTVDDIEPIVGSWSLSVGAVVFNSAPISGSKIIIKRNSPFERDRDFQLYDQSFRPTAINLDLDRIWRKLQELGVMDWLLGNRIDDLKKYVDDRDDELRAYLLEEIRKQGVALDQLEDYYNYLMQRLAEIAVNQGWDASLVVDASGKTQQEINNRLLTISNSSILNFFTTSELSAWLNDPENYDVSDIFIRYQTLSTSGEMQLPSGVFRITKAVPSNKNWVGARGAYGNRGTKVIVDNETAINPVIPLTASVGIELKDIHFEDKQNRKHTLYKQPAYQVKHSGLRVEKFAVGIDESGTYDYFEDCYFVNNGIGVKARAIAETGTDVQSTMWGFNRCFFVYNDIGIDTSPNYGIGPNEDFMNILLSTCGFELNRIGYNAPTRNWYLTFQNCWFEANSEFGLFAPNSDVLEINTRHNANSPKSVSNTQSVEMLPSRQRFNDVRLTSIENVVKANPVLVGSNLAFTTIYKATPSNVIESGSHLEQGFSCDSGTAKSGFYFYRDVGTGSTSNCGAGLRIYTQASAASVAADRWEFGQSGNLVPIVNNLLNIGSATQKLSSVYTTKVMYSSTVGDFFGTGSPEGVVAAGVGSTYRRTDGGANTCFYVKESGVGNTGWIAK